MMPSHWEFLVIFLVILLLFGAKRIPEMARGLGKGIKEFRSAVKDVQTEVDLSDQSTSRTTTNTIPPASPPPGQVAREDSQAEPAAESAQTGSTASSTAGTAAKDS